jgi:SAM-dependent methyltransferase
MAHDTWERHVIVAELAGGPESVLDVGGVAGELQAFMPASRVTTINVGGEEADLHFDGGRIPFDDGSFDLAVSLDVLEHIEGERRLAHLRELRRVARRRVILCCPLGTPEHIEAERDLAAWHREVTGDGHRFLEEHLETGLPTELELRNLAAEAGGFELRFQGDFRDVAKLFRLGVLARSRPSPATVARYARARLAARQRPELSELPGGHANRAFLIGPH